jgi:hypothetical protein
MKSHLKRTYIRSPKLLYNCRYLHCQLCGADDGTIVAAHSNQGKHGKGKGIKADDNMIAALCHICHMDIDQGSIYSKSERERLWDTTHLKTVYRLIEADLWPDSVPVPQTYIDYKNSLI